MLTFQNEGQKVWDSVKSRNP